MKLVKKRLPMGRPVGIPQPSGPERIKRNLAVIYDSILKRARAGEADQARLALEIVGEIPMKHNEKLKLIEELRKVAEAA